MTDKLWMIYIAGPDDVTAAPSQDEAQRAAKAFNEFFDQQTSLRRAELQAAGRNPNDVPTVHAYALEWKGTPANHADSITRDWPNYAALIQNAAAGHSQ